MAEIHQINVVNKIFPFEIWTSDSNKSYKMEINMHAVLGWMNTITLPLSILKRWWL